MKYNSIVHYNNRKYIHRKKVSLSEKSINKNTTHLISNDNQVVNIINQPIQIVNQSTYIPFNIITYRYLPLNCL